MSTEAAVGANVTLAADRIHTQAAVTTNTTTSTASRRRRPRGTSISTMSANPTHAFSSIAKSHELQEQGTCHAPDLAFSPDINSRSPSRLRTEVDIVAERRYQSASRRRRSPRTRVKCSATENFEDLHKES